MHCGDSRCFLSGPRHVGDSGSLSMLLIRRNVSLSILGKSTYSSIPCMGERVFAAWGWHLTYSVSLFTSLTQGTDLITNERICKVVRLQSRVAPTAWCLRLLVVMLMPVL